MGMGLCARSNPLSIHLFCSPASHCAPRLNRPGKKIWTCDCNVIQNKTTALTGRFFFLTSKQNLCSRSFRVNVWMEVNACTVCVCVFVRSALSPVSIFGAHWLWSEVRPDRSIAHLAFFFSFHSFWNDSFLSFSFAHIAFSCVTSLRNITSLN